ncbi:flagellar basal-body rod modification protein FlgD [Loktanella fryxellensis]|uniref:Basal-body rod modification protein FlgD n=1 Tax=Loktanella fryxellensis TaxID=245187 RepID=A0A1H7ZRW7_9RHOB|nr:flagellar hook capping FlgD N-terminal domain-containing protein [Loktanella fryxellensis]SEM61016.1 flagellar basal-body rod modification protein FlgD [Loktanella fryxellensis]
MTVITSPTTSATRTATIPAPATGSGTEISADFETFLKMLTVQMQNQDPLNPVDSSDYATQLATFSGVEQQVQTNDLLRTLSGQMGTGGLAQLAGWVGMQARAAVPAYFDGAPVTVVPKVEGGADAAEILVRNAAGNEVQRIDVPVAGGPMSWAGVASNGTPFPKGYYSFSTVSLSGEEVISDRPAEIYARVIEVQVAGGVNTVVLAGGRNVPVTQITAVRGGSTS